ncbi:MAG: 4'-phosphopantetheinyl transferase superfamily protein [Candidatus Caenarcaniphilales bacterium]|nr:4'-phosphopantetheinyl transferase superfamily protein [Candidatus Caenarcaniphilales bacterium]
MFPLEQNQLMAFIKRKLNIEVSIHVDNHRLSIDELTDSERKQLEKIRNEKKKLDWLKARKSLKNVLNSLGLSQDTSNIIFPSSRFSLSHSGGYAVAIGIQENCLIMDDPIKGIGIDLELSRTPKRGIEKYFLSPKEIDWLNSGDIDSQAKNRVRLWTVKEAVYKACPKNSQTRLTLFETNNPQEKEGFVNLNSGERINYLSIELQSFNYDEKVAEKPVVNLSEKKEFSFLSVAILGSYKTKP